MTVCSAFVQVGRSVIRCAILPFYGVIRDKIQKVHSVGNIFFFIYMGKKLVVERLGTSELYLENTASFS